MQDNIVNTDQDTMRNNEENMQKVRELMDKANKVQLGEDLKHGVDIDYISQAGKHYKGFVTFKKPTMRDFMRMGAIKSEILRVAGARDLNLVDYSIREMAQIMATLQTVVVKKPDWLDKMEQTEDYDMLVHVYDKYDEWDSSFRKPSEPAPNGDSEASTSSEAVGTP